MPGGKKRGGGGKKGDFGGEEGGSFKFNFGGADAGSEGSAFGVNPSLVSAIQDQLSGMVGKSSGYYESLPTVVKNRIRALKKLHNSKLEVDQEYKKAREELERKYADKYNVFYEKRTGYVTGQTEPKEEDMIPEEEEEESGVKIEEIKEPGKEEKKEEKKEDVKGVPEFWMTALKHNPELAQTIFPQDEEALKFLTDIKCKLFQEAPKAEEKKPAEKSPKKKGAEEEEEEEDEEAPPRHGFTLEFSFDENPFFENKLITKTYFLTDDLVYGDMYDSAEASEINWKAGKNLTMKKVQKKQKKKGKGGKGKQAERTVEVEERVDSFFNFFYPDQMVSEEPNEEDEAYLEEDYEFGVIIKDTIIPNAVLWFTGEISEEYGGLGGFDFGDEEEEEEDEEYSPAPTGDKPPECKQQ